MDSTTPTANFHPQMVQYTPADSSIETNVLALVSPSRSSVAFVRRKMRANLNLTSDAPTHPVRRHPAERRLLCGPGARSMARLRAPARRAREQGRRYVRTAKGRPGPTETHL